LARYQSVLQSAILSLCIGGLCLLGGCLKDPGGTPPPDPPARAEWLPDSVFVTTWSGGARAAWSIILDDFCGGWARGIQDYADTMFYNRGMVFSFAINPGNCDEAGWGEARRLVAHGHRPANHTMSQGCAVQDSWCPPPFWGPEDYPLELDSSAAWIERETGIRPTFMAFPYDLWTPELLTALRQRGYLGARASADRGKVNPADLRDGFDISWDLEFPPDGKQWQSYTLRGYYRAALEQGGWAFQSAHGVSDASYGSIEEDTLRALLDEMKVSVDSGTLWIAPAGTVIA
jgi:peptidoglycan/xylan/chitin deacetylase (PgdA/CDA1 family)